MTPFIRLMLATGGRVMHGDQLAVALSRFCIRIVGRIELEGTK